ncbi:hypothetical protein Pmani_014475 [Petrolisthes manimaculis]|uniref:Uncharacterized protein n=1 Tax=Petrolisthes manimaculis TaxID=1843537 RepID=A0AAE1PW47_9EUCA|nr:hypothetical protein Pmani_014475 [Petrolisthes manimaculis]
MLQFLCGSKGCHGGKDVGREEVLANSQRGAQITCVAVSSSVLTRTLVPPSSPASPHKHPLIPPAGQSSFPPIFPPNITTTAPGHEGSNFFLPSFNIVLEEEEKEEEKEEEEEEEEKEEKEEEEEEDEEGILTPLDKKSDDGAEDMIPRLNDSHFSAGLE